VAGRTVARVSAKKQGQLPGGEGAHGHRKLRTPKFLASRRVRERDGSAKKGAGEKAKKKGPTRRQSALSLETLNSKL
jgi:hypothetical protein